ncbi:MAG: hypothetical protein KF690_11290 [Bacteroidetes bacterium]|nr:hypothetical protein [Bacteroidota bacterium]
METNTLTQILECAYAQLAQAQGHLDRSLQTGMSQDIRVHTQLVTQLSRQVMQLERELKSPALQRAAILPFLRWLGEQEPPLAEIVSDEYTRWLEERQKA